MESMLSELALEIGFIRSIVVVTLPDCLLYSAWPKSSTDINSDEIASHYGELLRMVNKKLVALGATAEEVQITVECRDAVIVAVEVSPSYAVAARFEGEIPLGMVRIHMGQIISAVRKNLPGASLRSALAEE